MFEYPLSSNGSLIAGIIFGAIAAYYLFMLCFRPRTLRRTHRMRHGEGQEKGAPVSRVSGLAMVLVIGAFAYVSIADGYFHTITSSTGVRILLPLFFLLFATIVYDTIRARMRRSKPRPSRQSPTR